MIAINETKNSLRFLDGQSVYLLPNGMGKNRMELFQKALNRHGAQQIHDNCCAFENISRILVVVDETTVSSFPIASKVLGKKKFYLEAKQKSDCEIRVLKSLWLSECLKQKRLVELDSYEIRDENSAAKSETKLQMMENKKEGDKRKKITNESDDDENIPKRARSNSTSESGSDDDGFDNEYFERELKSKTSTLLNSKAWTCAHSSKEQKSSYQNAHIIKKLEEMSAIYESTRDKFRALSYQKAILALKRLDHPIRSREEVLAIEGIGKRLADRIWEIAETGDLDKLEYLKSRDDISSVELFTTVHGIGPTSAQNFVAQGFRTLDDLSAKANLNRQQKIGLKYHKEFLERIPRDEVVKIEAIVKEAALSINSGLIVETCGSYRRGKPTCGDVDILVTHADGHSHKNIFTKLINKLHENGFLTDDLVVQDDTSQDSHRKYLGVCKLPGDNSLHRRLDIIVVPYDEYACALIYFTGSAHFNRSMRHLARKLGLSLSEKSLNKNVIRKGSEKINVGERINTPTEQDVFKYLNIPYRTPEERDF